MQQSFHVKSKMSNTERFFFSHEQTPSMRPFPLNKKGEIVTGFLVAAVTIASLGGVALYKTSQNGVLKNNGKKIWCKVLNKGEEVCNEKYEFTPAPYHWEWGTNGHKVPAYVPDEEV